MKLRIPGKESFPSFVRTVGDQVSIKLVERRSITYSPSLVDPPRASLNIFWIVSRGKPTKILLDVDDEGGVHQGPGYWSRV